MATPRYGAHRARRYAVVLALLTLAFFGRVAGQFSVAFLGAEFLPPMEAWDSGLLRYAALLVAQIVILVIHVAIVRHVWTGSGRFAGRKPRAGGFLKWFSLVYFLVMLVRYVVTVWLPVELPWSPATIPIYFHWVLALHLYLLSRYYRRLPLARGRAG
ncbi:MAG: hypothetical protein ACE5GX_15015 [Thermoanaerobaculia bacterium]